MQAAQSVYPLQRGCVVAALSKRRPDVAVLNTRSAIVTSSDAGGCT